MHRGGAVLGALCLCASACSLPEVQEIEWLAWDARPPELLPELSVTRDGLPRGNALRVATYNIEYGEAIDDIARAWLANDNLSAADVILLQEIEAYPDEGASRAAKLAATLEMNYVYAPGRLQDSGTHGLAILSRFRFSNARVLDLPRVDTVIVSRERIALAVDLVLGDETLEIINVHLNVQMNLTERVAQLHPAASQSAERSTLGGDLNTNSYVWLDGVPITPLDAIANTDQNLGVDDYMNAMGFDAATADSGPTWAAAVVELRLDSLFTRNVASGAFGVERGLRMSDHDPLWLDLEW